jgi:hypothetical protein
MLSDMADQQNEEEEKRLQLQKEIEEEEKRQAHELALQQSKFGENQFWENPFGKDLDLDSLMEEYEQ